MHVEYKLLTLCAVEKISSPPSPPNFREKWEQAEVSTRWRWRGRKGERFFSNLFETPQYTYKTSDKVNNASRSQQEHLYRYTNILGYSLPSKYKIIVWQVFGLAETPSEVKWELVALLNYVLLIKIFIFFKSSRYSQDPTHKGRCTVTERALLFYRKIGYLKS